jgi:hypothetical protein
MFIMFPKNEKKYSMSLLNIIGKISHLHWSNIENPNEEIEEKSYLFEIIQEFWSVKTSGEIVISVW